MIQMVILLMVCTGSGVGAYVLAKKYSRARLPLMITGFVLLAPQLPPNLMPYHFGYMYPDTFLLEVIYAFVFILVGVVFAHYSENLRQRVTRDVLLIVVSYFIIADPIYFAINGDYIRTLSGNVESGVTIQSTGKSCVGASLATVLRRYGVEVTEGRAAWAVRTTFRGANMARLPSAVERLGRAKKLQGKIIFTDFDELCQLDAPAILNIRYGNIRHAIAVIGIDDDRVRIGEPLSRLGIEDWDREEYLEVSRWNGIAVIVAPDFLHSIYPGDTSKRGRELLDRLKSLGYNDETLGISKFQEDNGLGRLGYLDWKTILVIDRLTAPAGRPRLSTFTCGPEYRMTRREETVDVE